MNTIKLAGDYELDVLGVPFGSPSDKDADGDYFSATTKLHLDKFTSPAVLYYHGYDDNQNPDVEPKYIGRVISHEVKADGVWFRVVLDKAQDVARRVWESAKRGMAAASSGSILHLARKAKDGHILEWPMAELSIFETDTGKRPANKRAVALPVMKAVYDAAGMTLPDYIEPEPEGDASGALASVQSAEPETATGSADSTHMEGHEMSEEIATQVAEAVKAAIAAEREQRKQEEAAKAQRAQEDAELAAKTRAAAIAEFAAAGRLHTGAPTVRQFANLDKYDNVDTDSLSYMVGILDAAKTGGKSKYGATDNAVKALAVRFIESEDKNHRSVKSAMKSVGMPMKANELNQSTLADYGDEWVGVGYSSQLWRAVTANSNIVGRLPSVEIPQGQESIVIPTESTPPVFYKVAQASAQATNTLGAVTHTIPTSKMGTDNATLTVGKLGAAAIYTGELEEDSLIMWASELRMQLEREAQAVLESLVIDGDTDATATTNINDIAGTPAATDYFLTLNGFRKLALITNTANARSAGTFGIEDYLETLKLMGLGGKNALDRSAVSFITDLHTYWASMALAEVETRDVFAQPTIENGTLTGIYGRDLIATPNMHRANQDATYGLKTNSAGKLDLDTAANNLYGAILAVRWDQWRMGWKRRIKFAVQPYPLSDATAIVATMRVGLTYRDTDAAAISYGVSL